MAEHINENKDKESLNGRIDTLNRYAAEASPARKIFNTALVILTLIRDKLADSEDSAQLSDWCFDSCDTLRSAVQGKHTGNLIESEKIAMEGLERNMGEIERALSRAASSRHAKYSKENVEEHMLDTQQIISAFRAPVSSLGEGTSLGRGNSQLRSPEPQDPAMTTAAESACKRIIERRFTPPEFPSLLRVILSRKNESGKTDLFLADDAQMLIDAIDEMLCTPGLSPSTQKMCLKLLYRECGNHALLPGALIVSVPFNQPGSTLRRGGFADVWKAEHHDRNVAVKVIRTYTERELGKVINRFCKEVVMWRFLRHPNVIPLVGVMMSENLFAMVSDWMSSGDINAYIESNPNVDRLRLLEGVAKGLIYLHDNGLVHGDLKGANILIDDSGNARLADFGLLAIISSSASLFSSGSSGQGGTIRWMGPELLAPERFGLKRSLATKLSDCYAFGMVIYEVISGKTPFHKDADYAILPKVLDGKRPPRGDKFTGRLWKVVNLCWASQPNDRPCIEDVLRCLETASNLSEPPSPRPDGDMESDSDDGDWSDRASPVEDEGSDIVTEAKNPIESSQRSVLDRVSVQSQVPQVVKPPVERSNGHLDEEIRGFGTGPHSFDPELNTPNRPSSPRGPGILDHSVPSVNPNTIPPDIPSQPDSRRNIRGNDDVDESTHDQNEDCDPADSHSPSLLRVLDRSVGTSATKIARKLKRVFTLGGLLPTTVGTPLVLRSDSLLPQSSPSSAGTIRNGNLRAYNLSLRPTRVGSGIRRAMVERQGGSDGENQTTPMGIRGSLMPASRENGEPPPPPPRACFGRDDLIEQLVSLAENLECVALVGAGGIGKTHVALAVLHHHRIKKRFGNERWFIRCDRFSPSCQNFLSRISRVIGAGIANPEDLVSLRPFLSEKEMILFLDNVESIIDPQGADAREIYAVVEELSRFTNISLWITSRISMIPPDVKLLPISTLSIESACDIFYNIYDSGGKSEVISELVEQLDFHPLSITLLATVASNSMWDYDRLAREWRTQHSQILQTGYYGSIRATIELSLASPSFRKLGPDARNLLEVVAFFPQGVDEDNLDWLLPSIPGVKDIFHTYCVLSLTFRNKKFVTMLAPVRDCLRPQDPASSPPLCMVKESYFSRLRSEIDPGGLSFEAGRWVVSEDVNIEYLLDVFTSIDMNSDVVWRACADFVRHLRFHKPRHTVLGPKIERLPDNHLFKPANLVELSLLYETAGNSSEQKRLLIRVLELYREREDDRHIARALMRLSDANRKLGFHEEGMQQANEAFRIHELLGDTVGQANCLLHLARLLASDNQPDAAEEASSRAIGLLPEEGEEILVCQSHRALGHIYKSKGERGSASFHYGLSLGIASRFRLHAELFWGHHALAQLLLDEDGFDDAHVHIDQAKLHVANDKYLLGCAMSTKATIWYRQRRFEDAIPKALGALEIFEKLGASRDVEQCEDLLRRIKQEQETTVTAKFESRSSRFSNPFRKRPGNGPGRRTLQTLLSPSGGV